MARPLLLSRGKPLTKGGRAMAETKDVSRRDRLGFGSTYRKGGLREGMASQDLVAVLGGQTWMVKPDKAPEHKNPCLWMQAGAVKFKDCNHFYDCATCRYDKGMQLQVEKGKQISWQDAMRRLPEMHRMCRHSLTGRIQSRVCAYDYQCGTCDFDQFFEDVWNLKTESHPTETQNVRGFDVPFGYYYHQGHAWARIESGGCVRVGIDDFALKLLGSADTFELPLMGNELDQGRAGWGFRRGNHDAEVLSPVSGVIMEVNAKIRENPNLSGRDPYGAGWLFMVHTPDVKKTIQPLMAMAESLNWMNHEVHHLEGMIEEVAGPLAADGGYLTRDIYGALPSLGWDNLTKTFLKT